MRKFAKSRKTGVLYAYSPAREKDTQNWEIVTGDAKSAPAPDEVVINSKSKGKGKPNTKAKAEAPVEPATASDDSDDGSMIDGMDN